MDFKNLLAYKKGFKLAMDIYAATKQFPPNEYKILTQPLRSATRMACCNITESFINRDYPDLFIKQLTSSDGHIHTTLVLLQFAKACNFLNSEVYEKLELQTEEVSIMINYMINHPEKFGSRKTH